MNDRRVGVRPAFNLNLNSVLFTSAAAGGKSSTAESGGNLGGEAADAIFSNAAYSGNEWKVTLKDASRSGFSIDNSNILYTGTQLQIPYSDAKTGANEYISAMVKGSDDEVKY